MAPLVLSTAVLFRENYNIMQLFTEYYWSKSVSLSNSAVRISQIGEVLLRGKAKYS